MLLRIKTETKENSTTKKNIMTTTEQTFMDCDSPKIQNWKGKKYMRPLDLYNLYKNGVLTSIKGF